MSPAQLASLCADEQTAGLIGSLRDRAGDLGNPTLHPGRSVGATCIVCRSLACAALLMMPYTRRERSLIGRARVCGAEASLPSQLFATSR